MDKFVALLASGIAQGAIVAVASLGFLVLYKATGVINFAHGDLMTLGAYFAVWAVNDLHLGVIVASLLALALMLPVGAVFERLVYAPLRGRSDLVVIIATLGAAIVIRSLVGLWQGTEPKRLPSPVGNGAFHVFGASIAYQRLLIVAIGAVAVCVLLVVFHRTSFGRQVRALASDRETAMLYGVRVRSISTLVFAVSAMLAGLAGILLAPLVSVDLNLGFGVLLTAFAAAILGGFGSLGGVVGAAMFLALVQQVVGGYLVPNYSDTLVFAVMLAVIAFRPRGLFGRGVAARL